MLFAVFVAGVVVVVVAVVVVLGYHALHYCVQNLKIQCCFLRFRL